MDTEGRLKVDFQTAFVMFRIWMDGSLLRLFNSVSACLTAFSKPEIRSSYLA